MGRILAIDYGEQRIGLALSDPLKIFASPYKTIINKNKDHSINLIENIIKIEDVELIVVGLPLAMSGKSTDQTLKVKKFADKLLIEGFKIEYVDERWSSKAAKRSIVEQGFKTGHNKSVVDQTAAALFLQQYLDQK